MMWGAVSGTVTSMFRSWSIGSLGTHPVGTALPPKAPLARPARSLAGGGREGEHSRSDAMTGCFRSKASTGRESSCAGIHLTLQIELAINTLGGETLLPEHLLRDQAWWFASGPSRERSDHLQRSEVTLDLEDNRTGDGTCGLQCGGRQCQWPRPLQCDAAWRCEAATRSARRRWCGCMDAATAAAAAALAADQARQPFSPEGGG